MPSFYNTLSAQRMPLTPPETYGRYFDNGYSSVQTSALQATKAGQKPSASYYSTRTHEAETASNHYQHYQPATLPQPTYFLEPNGPPPAYVGSPRNESVKYAPVSAPLLPPIRAPGRSADDYNRQVQTKHAPPAPQEKEEKVGGVAAHLDYEMDVMVDFVSEMAQGMHAIFASKICLADIDMTRSVLSSKSQPHGDFRKYVSQVLSSTRLPSSTVLLALLYLSKRMTFLSKRGQYGQGTRDVYSMLTTALVLGSKFLDDNTFQNRSWSEVSNIAVSELNFLEIQWLVDVQWDLHIDQDDNEGFQLWLHHWEKFQARKDDVSLANSMMQTNLDGNVRQRQQNRAAPKLPPLKTELLPFQPDHSSMVGYVNERHGPWNTPQHVQWQQTRGQNENSPPSAPETGPNTPDAFGLLNSFRYPPQPVHPTLKLPPTLQMLPPNAPSSSYPTPYAPQYSHYAPSKYCDSTFCTPHHERYFMAPGYGPQSVAG